MNSLQGHLLISTPDLRDGNFAQAIVLILGHNEEGAMGLVLNRPSETSIQYAWEQVRETSCQRTELVRVGGPCPGPLMVLHQRPLLSNATALPEVYLTQSTELIEQLVDCTEGPMRFFLGYAGWGPGQLENELEVGAWLTLPATADHVFSERELDWDLLLRRAGSANFYSSLGFPHVPSDPNVN
jgi:putative transcriptional regulator